MTRNFASSLWVALSLIAVPSTVVHSADVARDDDRRRIVLAMAADRTTPAASGPSALERTQSCDSKRALRAVEEILSDASSFDTPNNLFVVATALFQHGRKDDAVFWFYAAQLRARYQAVFEKESGGLLLSSMLMTIGVPINNYAFQDTSKLDEILDRVIEWDRTAPNRYRERMKAEGAEEQVAQIYAGLDELKAKLVTDKQELERQARAAAPGMEQVLSEKRGKVCSGEVDPADARQVQAKESKAVIAWLKQEQEVQRAVGTVANAWPYSAIHGKDDLLPHRYIVMVTGEQGMRVFPVIDVSRSSGEAQFTLVCISRISPGDLDTREKLCEE